MRNRSLFLALVFQTPGLVTTRMTSLHVHNVNLASNVEDRVVSGKERSDIRMTLFKSLRPLPLMHNWVFWFDRFGLL